MTRLEQIVPGSRIRGIAGDEFVEVLAARSFGPDAVEVTYKASGRVDQTVLFRSSESELELATPSRRFGFDGDGRLEGTLSDNGVGFQKEIIKSETRFGLAGMEERVKQLGGAFLVKSSPGNGTKISFFVPLELSNEVEPLPAA